MIEQLAYVRLYCNFHPLSSFSLSGEFVQALCSWWALELASHCLCGIIDKHSEMSVNVVGTPKRLSLKR